jgi:hypothetical protein
MREFQRTGLQGPNNAQRSPNNNILCIFAADFSLEAVGDVGVAEAFDTLGHRPFEDDVERVLIVAGREDLGLSLAGFSESPCLLVEYALSPGLSTASGGATREVPTIDAG